MNSFNDYKLTVLGLIRQLKRVEEDTGYHGLISRQLRDLGIKLRFPDVLKTSWSKSEAYRKIAMEENLSENYICIIVHKELPCLPCVGNSILKKPQSSR